MRLVYSSVSSSVFVLAALLVTATGCGNSGPEVADVSGKVTLGGKPVPSATVTFRPVATGGTYSVGKTDDQGNYSLGFTQDRSGALIGEHTVEIVTKKISKDELPDTGVAVSTTFVEIPVRYRKPGALRATVESKRNTINFELDAK